MSASRFDMEIQRGGRFVLDVTVSANGAAIDLSTYTLIACARKSVDESGVIVVTFTCTPDPDQVANKGKAKLTLTTAQTAALLVGVYPWDCFLEAADGERDKILFGNASVIPRITT